MKPRPSTARSADAADGNLRFGWWALLGWLTLGIALEALHGFKAGWLLDAGNETRRLMFRLAHTHGTLLALVNIAAALTTRATNPVVLAPTTSFSLLWGAVLMPVGFLLGGIVTHGGDPGLGVWIVPFGALLLFYGVGRLARDVSRRS